MAIQLRPKNQVTIPTKLTDALGWRVGEPLSITEEDGQIVIRRDPLSSTEPKSRLSDALRTFERITLPDGVAVADLIATDRDGAE